MGEPPQPPPFVQLDPYPRPETSSTSSFDRIVPTKNPSALAAYYLGLFSVLPLLGILLGAAGVWLGIVGLGKVRATPGLPGKAHSTVGIGCGLLGLLLNLATVASVVMAIATRRP